MRDLLLPGWAAFVLAAALLARRLAARYGSLAALRFLAGAVVALTVQTVLATAGMRRFGTRPTPVDVLTLSRSLSVAVLTGLLVSGVKDRRGDAGWIGFAAVIYGAIVTDWLDGPLARTAGASAIRETLDWESDSLLTLSTSAVSVRWGDLPPVVLLPPVLRYVTVLRAVRHGRYLAVREAKPWWDRPLGIAQMTLFAAALAPFRGPMTERAVRAVFPAHLVLQAVGWIATQRYERSL
ncbi:MAG TPA: CDP-alcohol phosphatidyltransferase family protein [Chloroflexota bacterium]|nr:CDP-alcohol phosphatidyltransferase family protein [Chloroflexota bacterium]